MQLRSCHEVSLYALLSLLVACSGSPPAPVAPTPVPVDAPAPAVPPAPIDAAAMYAECRTRVEEPEADSECTSDADCVSTGCSGEVCTTRSVGLDLATTCEVLDCFDVLDACGCHGGRCTWTTRAP